MESWPLAILLFIVVALLVAWNLHAQLKRRSRRRAMAARLDRAMRLNRSINQGAVRAYNGEQAVVVNSGFTPAADDGGAASGGGGGDGGGCGGD